MIWIIGLVVFAQRIHYWSGVVEDLDMEWFNTDPEHRNPDSDFFLERQEASGSLGSWSAGAILWGVLGLIALVLAWWRERREDTALDASVHGPPH